MLKWKPLICFEADGVGGGESVASEPASQEYVEASTDYSADDSYSSQESSSESTVITCDTDDGGMSLVKDPETGAMTLKMGNSEEEQQEETSLEYTPQGDGFSDVANVGSTGVNTRYPKYTLEEFSQAVASGNVDSTRVPQEYQAQYADYKIRQAMNEFAARKQIEAQQRAEVEKQLSPENRVQANKDFFRQLNNEAKAAALKDLGITQEDLDDAEFATDGEQIKDDFNTAFEWHKQQLTERLKARSNAENRYRAEQQSVYSEITDFVARERAKNPQGFEEIDKYSLQLVTELPLRVGMPIMQAFEALKQGVITREQSQILLNHYKNTEKLMVAKRNGLSTTPRRVNTPPVVENAGQGREINTSYRPNYKALRNANADGKEAWFKEFFKNTGW